MMLFISAIAVFRADRQSPSNRELTVYIPLPMAVKKLPKA